jgi:hypothetical protein
MTLSINASLTIASTLSIFDNQNDPAANPITVAANPPYINQTWNAALSPNGTAGWCAQVVMTSGAATIDLTSLTQLGLSTPIDATGLKSLFFVFQAPTSNTNPVSVAPGGSNGYASVGEVGPLSPGDIDAKTTGSATAISSTSKTISVTGTGSNAINIFVAFGS